MNYFLTLLMFLVVSKSYADIITSSQTYKSAITAKYAFELPGDVIQIIEPRLHLSNGYDDNPPLFAATSINGKVICGEVNKTFIGYDERYLTETAGGSPHTYLYFDEYGAMTSKSTAQLKSGSFVAVIKIISCK